MWFKSKLNRIYARFLWSAIQSSHGITLVQDVWVDVLELWKYLSCDIQKETTLKTVFVMWNALPLISLSSCSHDSCHLGLPKQLGKRIQLSYGTTTLAGRFQGSQSLHGCGLHLIYTCSINLRDLRTWDQTQILWPSFSWTHVRCGRNWW